MSCSSLILMLGMICSTTATADGEEITAEAILRGHNVERKIAKLPTFTLSAELGKAALAHAKDMAEHSKLTHEGTNGSSPFDRIKGVGYQYQGAAENVARGQTTVAQVMADWMKSEHHRENIVGDYTEIGVAVVADADGQNFWCVDFGKPWPKVDPKATGKDVVDLINRQRTKIGKKALMHEPKLSKAATWQAEQMASGSSLETKASKSTDVFEKIKDEGLRYQSVAQTAAVGLATPADLVKYWLDQPEYEKTLLDDFKDAGVGYAKDAKGNPFWCLLLGKAQAKQKGLR